MTAATDLAATDLVGAVVAYLQANTDVTAALTTNGSAVGHVSARNQPPYPHLRVTDPVGGNLGQGRWLVAEVVQIEVLGDPDGTGGKAALKRIGRTVVGALADMPYATTVAGAPVITDIGFNGGLGWSPEPTGQPRYVLSVNVTGHPPQH